TIDKTGNVGIGTSVAVGYGTAGPILDIKGSATTYPEITMDATAAGGGQFTMISDVSGPSPYWYIHDSVANSNPLGIVAGVVSTPRLAAGSPGAQTTSTIQAIEQGNGALRGITSSQFSSDTQAASLNLTKARGVYSGTVLSVQNGDYIGAIAAEPYDG